MEIVVSFSWCNKSFSALSNLVTAVKASRRGTARVLEECTLTSWKNEIFLCFDQLHNNTPLRVYKH